MRKYLVVVTALLALLLTGMTATGALQSSPKPSQFNVTPSTLHINWTSTVTGTQFESNITLGFNSSELGNFKGTVQNASHTVSENYSQPLTNWRTTGDFPSSCTSNLKFHVRNATDFLSQNATPPSTGSLVTNITIISPKKRNCMPGQYRGKINVTNATDTTHFTNTTIDMDIPIASENTFVTSGDNNGVGQFRGTVDANETTFHEYFFNTSELVNATSVTVNLTWADPSVNDMDMFLFDNNENFLEAANNRSSEEQLVHLYPKSDSMFSIRVYVNNSSSGVSYDSPGAFLILGTLNASNASSTNELLDDVDFGSVNSGETKTVNVTLENVGQANQSDVVETTQLRMLQRFEDGSPSGPRNFSLRVPDFVKKLDVRLNWTGHTNYTLQLIKPDGTSVDISADKSQLANTTGANQEEFVTYNPSGTIGFTEDGLWTVQVKNNSVNPNAYNVTAHLLVDSSEWISSNYTTRDFNETDIATGKSAVHQFNLTVPNSTLSGEVDGRLRYTSGTGAVLDIPINASVSAGELFVNDTFNKSTIEQKDNIGFNRTGSGSITFNVTVNNTGNADVTFDNRANSTGINLTTSTSKFIDFVIDDPTGTLAAGDSTTLNITADVDTTETDNSEGLYEGWIFLNDTGALPYQGFNLTVEVNLTSELDDSIHSVQTLDSDNEIENVSVEQNFTVHSEVFYKNGTELDDTNDARELDRVSGNWSIYIVEGNTSTRFPNSGGFTAFNATTSAADGLFHNGVYKLNATIPSDSERPGGVYTIHAEPTHKINGITLTGDATNSSQELRINNTGLWIKPVDSTGFSVADDSTTTFNVTVQNLGPVAPGGNLQMEDPSDATVTANNESSNCRQDQSDNKFTFDASSNGNTIDPNNAETCWFEFKIDPANVSSETTNTVDVKAAGGDADFGHVTVDITITDSDSGSSDDSSNGGGGGGGGGNETSDDNETEETDILDIVSFPGSVEIVQGGEKTVTVTVENTGDDEQTSVSLAVRGVRQSWRSISPANQTFLPDEQLDYTVDYVIPGDAEIGFYEITYVASNDDTTTSQSSNLTVRPDEETKSEIDESYTALLQNSTGLEDEVARLRDEGYNVSEANETLTQLNSKLEAAGDALERGDYVEADRLLTEAESLMSQLEDQLNQAEQQAAGGPGPLVFGIIAVVILSVGGLVLYMFLPPAEEEYQPGRFEYTHPGGDTLPAKARVKAKEIKEKIEDKLRELIEKLTGEPRDRSYDYERRGSKWS